MARPCICHNPPPTGKNELAKNTPGVPIKSSSTPAPAQAPASTQTPTPAPGPLGIYTDVDLQKATRLALELFVKGQKYGRANSASRNRALKACNPDLYYGTLHMECYYFCQQCEDHFDTAGATSYQRVLFAASFLCNKINFR